MKSISLGPSNSAQRFVLVGILVTGAIALIAKGASAGGSK